MKNFEQLVKSTDEFACLIKKQNISSILQRYKENTDEEYEIFRIITFDNDNETATVYDFESDSLGNGYKDIISVWEADLNYNDFIEYKNKYGDYEVLNDAESIAITDFLVSNEVLY